MEIDPISQRRNRRDHERTKIQYNALYVSQPTLIQASALMTMAVPVIVFFLAQRAFMRGVVVTGVEK